MRATRGIVGWLGAARAVRDPTAGFTPILAVVSGVSAALFSLVMATTLSVGLSAAAHEEVGADISVDAPELSAAVISHIASTRGVDEVAVLDRVDDVTLAAGHTEEHTNVVFVDTEQLHAVRPDIKVLVATAASGSIPYLASPVVASRIPDGVTALNDQDATRAGTLPQLAIPGVGPSWVLVDTRYQRQITQESFQPTQVLVSLRDGANSAVATDSIRTAVLSAQRDAERAEVEVISASAVQAEAQTRPSIVALSLALRLDAVLCVVLGALAIVISSIAAAASRNRVVGVLRMLGLSTRQSRKLIGWELAPGIITAVFVGAAVGLALPSLLSGVIDLSGFVGGPPGVSPTIRLPLIAAVIAGFAAVAVAAGSIAVAVAQRTSPVKTIKMGSE